MKALIILTVGLLVAVAGYHMALGQEINRQTIKMNQPQETRMNCYNQNECLIQARMALELSGLNQGQPVQVNGVRG